MYYVLWFFIVMSASLLAVVTGLWVDRKIDDKQED